MKEGVNILWTTICNWIINIDPEIVMRLQKNKAAIVGWYASEKYIVILIVNWRNEISIEENLKIEIHIVVLVALNCCVVVWMSINLTRWSIMRVALPLTLAHRLISCKALFISLVNAFENKNVPIAKVHKAENNSHEKLMRWTKWFNEY